MKSHCRAGRTTDSMLVTTHVPADTRTLNTRTGQPSGAAETEAAAAQRPRTMRLRGGDERRRRLSINAPQLLHGRAASRGSGPDFGQVHSSCCGANGSVLQGSPATRYFRASMGTSLHALLRRPESCARRRRACRPHVAAAVSARECGGVALEVAGMLNECVCLYVGERESVRVNGCVRASDWE